MCYHGSVFFNTEYTRNRLSAGLRSNPLRSSKRPSDSLAGSGEEIPRTGQKHKGNGRKRMDEMEIVEGLREEERRGGNEVRGKRYTVPYWHFSCFPTSTLRIEHPQRARTRNSGVVLCAVCLKASQHISS